MRIRLGKKLSLLVMALGFSCMVMAQQEAQFTQYMFNRMSYNPGFAGSSGSICATLMYRNQWMGLTLDKPAPGKEAGSAPVDYLFTFDMPIKALHGGLGITATMDQIGYRSNTSIFLDYAFRMNWGAGNLSAAIEAALYSNSLDYANLIGSDDVTGDPSNPYSSSGDPLLSNGKASEMLFDVSTGLYYQVPGEYYLGLSVKNLLGAKSDVLNYKNARTVYLMGGYEYTPSTNPSIKFKPSFLLKTASFSTFQADVSCLMEYRNLVWGGLSYRVQDALAILGGVNWKIKRDMMMRIGAAYDFTTNQLGSYKVGRSLGTLELYLKFCFKVIIPPTPPTSYGNTRHLL